MTQTQSEQDNRKNSSRENTNPRTLHEAEKKQHSTAAGTAQALEIPPSFYSQQQHRTTKTICAAHSSSYIHKST
jgi:hypothetical protein